MIEFKHGKYYRSSICGQPHQHPVEPNSMSYVVFVEYIGHYEGREGRPLVNLVHAYVGIMSRTENDLWMNECAAEIQKAEFDDAVLKTMSTIFQRLDGVGL